MENIRKKIFEFEITNFEFKKNFEFYSIITEEEYLKIKFILYHENYNGENLYSDFLFFLDNKNKSGYFDYGNKIALLFINHPKYNSKIKPIIFTNLNFLFDNYITYEIYFKFSNISSYNDIFEKLEPQYFYQLFKFSVGKNLGIKSLVKFITVPTRKLGQLFKYNKNIFLLYYELKRTI
jgi:hypothetical protein